jgi:hypothetical protein
MLEMKRRHLELQAAHAELSRLHAEAATPALEQAGKYRSTIATQEKVGEAVQAHTAVCASSFDE